MKSIIYAIFVFVLLLLTVFSAAMAQNLLVNGDLETVEPGFWTKLNDGMGGAQCTWATDEAVDNSLRSFKIVKASTTADMVGWVSDNNADLYWNNAGGNDLYNLGVWAKTMNVNTNPANQDEMIGVWFKFYAAGALLAEQFVAVDQSSASIDWAEYTGGVLVPSEPDSVVALAVMGMNATGTVWFDNYNCNTNAGWTMGLFNGDAETPVGWMQWASSGDVGYVALTQDPDAYSGNYDALLVEKDTLADEIVFYSEPTAVNPDQWYIFQAMIKTDSINTDASYYPTNAMAHFDDQRMGICFFFHRSPLNTNWDLTGGDQFYYVDQTTNAAGWTLYSVIVKSPSDAAGASIRARFNNFPTGYAWYDDFVIMELDETPPNVIVNGDLETVEPGFWTKLNDGMGGAQCTWATDEAVVNSLRSFKIVKASTTADMVGWVSDNNADLYWNNAGGNDLYNLGVWAKTMNVNTNPANQDEMIGVWFKFYAAGALLAEQFVAVDQSSASIDWAEYTGGVLVPSEPDSVVALAVMGMNATGTVWFDNYNCNTNAGWTMGLFNGDAETPVGWMQWASSGDVGYVALTQDPDAYSGNYDALLVEKDTLADEIVFYSEPGACDARKWYLFSVWVKTDSINTASDFYPTNSMGHFDDQRMGICFFFHRSPLYTNWDLTGGDQFFYIDQTADSAGWTRYAAFAQAPEDAAGVSMRARYNNFPTGYAWYDDFQIIEIPDILVTIEEPGTKISTLANDFLLKQNYPNPFNPETIIEYVVPERGLVELNIYNLLGQKVRTLVNDVKSAGTYQILWDGRDDHGNSIATGMYLYQLRSENAFITKKMMLIK